MKPGSQVAAACARATRGRRGHARKVPSTLEPLSEPLWTRADLARLLKTTANRIAKWKSEGVLTLPEVILTDHMIRYRKLDIDKWIESHIQRPAE